MSTICTNINIDSDLKLKSQTLFKQAVPFRVGAPIPNVETRTAIENARHGVGLSKGFSSVSELIEDLGIFGIATLMRSKPFPFSKINRYASQS